MSFEEIQKAVTCAPPTPGEKCSVCDKSVDKISSIAINIKVFLKTFKKFICLMCAKEVKAFFDLRIDQAERGECR